MDRTPMQLSTTTIGSGSRTAALVHGLSASSLHWTEFARLLAEEQDCTVTLVDLRGHGDSPRTHDPDRSHHPLTAHLPPMAGSAAGMRHGDDVEAVDAGEVARVARVDRQFGRDADCSDHRVIGAGR